jgi:hypothetical protein
VPIKLSSLRALLHRHKDRLSPAKYVGQMRRGKRLFTAEDVRFLRSIFVRSRQ